MPWASLTEPSLALGILKAKLLENGIPCTVRHQNLFLLERPVGQEIFDSFSFVDVVNENPKTSKHSLDHALLQNAISQRIVTRRELTLELQDKLKTTTVAEILDDFDRERLVYKEGGQIVGLAFPAACYKKREELRNQPFP